MRILTALLLLPMSVTAADECREIVMGETDVASIEATLNHATHLILPEPLTKDVPGNTSLWVFSGEHGSEHYWIKPGDGETDDGASTSLTLLTASRSYDFELIRTPTPRSLCVRILERLPLGAGAIAPTKAVTAPADATLPAYTRYSWRGDAIDSIFDDGRFTYVRLSPRAEGREVPTVSGGTRKRPQLIESRYDAISRTFNVPGVHDVLVVTVDGKPIQVERGHD